MPLRGPLKSSANAGQMSEDLQGKVGLKQYYSAARLMRGFEPIAQSGFALMPGSVDVGAALSPVCKFGVLKVNASLSYALLFSDGKCEIWRKDRVKRATLTIAGITEAMIPDLKFFGEANTFGVFHPLLNNGVGLRISRNPADDTSWAVTSWPLANIPLVDLGGTYTKRTDIWDIFMRWSEGAPNITLSCSIDGNVVPSLGLGATPDASDNANWTTMAASLETLISTLAGFETGVTVAYTSSATRYRVFRVTFGGALAGKEYQFDANIVSTSQASALVSHVRIGKTIGEPLVSLEQGGFAGMALYQDRATYFGPSARPAAVAMSEIGEYFNLNIENSSPNGARLDALRTSTSETIHHVLDNTYLLVFTDQAEWFASNRTINRNEPLNFVRASEIGSRRNCNPVSIDGLVFFVSPDGGVLYSIVYDAVSTTYTPTPENDLAKDLLRLMADQVVQRKIAESTTTRNWIRRDDGRLICLIVNKAREQNIVAPAEWGVHFGGQVRAHCVDGAEQVWIVVERGGEARVEVLEEASLNLFQAAIRVTTSAGGVASGLSVHNGRTVWAEIEGDIFGPYTVAGGEISIPEAPSKAAIIGLWQPPVYDCMPYFRVLQDDSVVKRPGAVKAAAIYVMDTTSLAVGANDRPAKNVPLNRTSDDLSAPKSGFTGEVLVAGLNGVSRAPTLTITQVRPGRLRLRDYVPEVKL